MTSRTNSGKLLFFSRCQRNLTTSRQHHPQPPTLASVPLGKCPRVCALSLTTGSMAVRWACPPTPQRVLSDFGSAQITSIHGLTFLRFLRLILELCSCPRAHNLYPFFCKTIPPREPPQEVPMDAEDLPASGSGSCVYNNNKNTKNTRGRCLCLWRTTLPLSGGIAGEICQTH